jgi:hypothetical protein
MMASFSGDCPMRVADSCFSVAATVPLGLWLYPADKISSKRNGTAPTKNRSRHTLVRSKEVATARQEQVEQNRTSAMFLAG